MGDRRYSISRITVNLPLQKGGPAVPAITRYFDLLPRVNSLRPVAPTSPVYVHDNVTDQNRWNYSLLLRATTCTAGPTCGPRKSVRHYSEIERSPVNARHPGGRRFLFLFSDESELLLILHVVCDEDNARQRNQGLDGRLTFCPLKTQPPGAPHDDGPPGDDDFPVS
jgi:hypothetical protein